MSDIKFKQGDKLYFKSPCTQKHKVIFDRYSDNNTGNCYVTFHCLNGEKDVLSIVYDKFLKYR